jgi:hypothetical protein
MWHAVSIVYYGDHLVGLLQEPLQSAIACLRSELGLSRIMLLPRWLYGPHLDLVVECSEQRFASEVMPRCAKWFGDWLATHPSNAVLEPTAYAAFSEKMALVELETGPFLPLLPNNSVLSARYTPSRALKLAAIASAKEDFLCSTLDLSFDLLALKQQHPDHFFLTLVAMMTVLGKSYRHDGLRRGYLSFRSHAEYFFAAYDDLDGVLRRRFDALDQNVADVTEVIVREVHDGHLASLPLPAAPIALLQRWEDIVATTAAANEAIVARHHEALLADNTFELLALEAAAHIPSKIIQRTQQRAPSRVAVAMQQDEGMRVLSSREFMAYRTTVNFFYYLLPLVGVSPMKKFCLCHVTSNATERALGISWQRLLGIDNAMGVQNEIRD